MSSAIAGNNNAIMIVVPLWRNTCPVGILHALSSQIPQFGKNTKRRGILFCAWYYSLRLLDFQKKALEISSPLPFPPCPALPCPAPPFSRKANPPPPKKPSRKLPTIPTKLALTKRRHRLIRRPGLRLRIAHLLLPTLATLQRGRDRLLLLGHHRVVHILLGDGRIGRDLLLALELLVGHDHQPRGADLAGQDAHFEVGVGFVAQVLVEGADLVAVGGGGAVASGAGEVDGGLFDRFGGFEDLFGGVGGVLAEAVVQQTDAVVARRVIGAFIT